MISLLAAMIFAAPLPPTGGTCTEACVWVKFLGSAGYACVSGTAGRNCVSTGNVCSIFTSCRFTAILGPDGSVLALQRSCRRNPVPESAATDA